MTTEGEEDEGDDDEGDDEDRKNDEGKNEERDVIARIRDRSPFGMTLVALSVLAWISLLMWGQSTYGRYLSHEPIEDASQGNWALLTVFVLGWTVMTIAMMLPTSLPLIVMFQRLTRRRRDGIRLIALLLAGYLTICVMFGIFAHLGDAIVHRIVDTTPWLAGRTWIIGATIPGLAGAFQFTPFKYHCLDKCRSPLGFITAHWHGQSEHLEALRLGIHPGLFCLGCCWALMLLMFAVGPGNLGWMLALVTVMAIEQNVSWGRKIGRPLGVALVGWAAIVALTNSAFLN